MTLVFSDRGLIERDCKIVWSDGSDVAVKFIGIPRSVAFGPYSRLQQRTS
jgi:hypothetical protein